MYIEVLQHSLTAPSVQDHNMVAQNLSVCSFDCWRRRAITVIILYTGVVATGVLTHRRRRSFETAPLTVIVTNT